MTQRSNSTRRSDAVPPFGGVNALGLQKLRATFDTTHLLHAVDDIDIVRAVLADPDELRDDLLRLHLMTHALINGGAIATASADETIPELAANIEAELERISALLLDIRQRIRPLLTLAPDED